MPSLKLLNAACSAGFCCCAAAAAAGPAFARDEVAVELGGRLVHEFAWSRDGVGPFDRHSFAPGVCARLSERATVAGEIEFAQDGLAGGSGDGEITLTFAVMEYRFRDEFQFRGGVIQSPLGGINLHHGSPLDDLTELPLVDDALLLSGQRESGLGFFGDLGLAGGAAASYEAYLVNGFAADDTCGAGAAQAVAARLELRPQPGLGLAASAHSGRCGAQGDGRLAVAALDVRAERGDLRLRGALATASAHAAAAPRRRGAYVQLDWRARRDLLMRGSSLDLIVRADAADLDDGGGRGSALTLGLNFLPSADAVFRLDHTWNRAADGGGEAARAPGRTRFSVATCF